MLIGKIEFGKHQKDITEQEGNEFVYTDEENNQFKMQTKDMEDWALLLNSPWSQNLFGYEIELNCKDSYTEMRQEDPQWRCRYYTIGYDGITASCIGYGNTEEEALKNCKTLFEALQKEYNKNGESI